MADALVNILAQSNTPVDVKTVTTGAGAVNRQRVALQNDVGGGDAQAIANFDLIALGAVNGTPTVDRLRTAQGASDGWNGLGLLGVGPYLDNPNGVFDHWRSIYPSGYGFGVAKVGGDTYLANTSCTAAQAAAGFTLVNAVGTRGLWKRKLRIQSTLNAVATVNVFIYNAAGLNFLSLQLSVPNGATTTVQSEINDVAISTTFGAAVTLASGQNLSVLATPGDLFTVAVTAPGATSGIFSLDALGLS